VQVSHEGHARSPAAKVIEVGLVGLLVGVVLRVVKEVSDEAASRLGEQQRTLLFRLIGVFLKPGSVPAATDVLGGVEDDATLLFHCLSQVVFLVVQSTLMVLGPVRHSANEDDPIAGSDAEGSNPATGLRRLSRPARRGVLARFTHHLPPAVP
jgi:hypothetical protein